MTQPCWYHCPAGACIDPQMCEIGEKLMNEAKKPTDQELAQAVRQAYQALWQRIDAAQKVGLRVDYGDLEDHLGRASAGEGQFIRITRPL